MSLSNGLPSEEIVLSDVFYNIIGTNKMSQEMGCCIYKITSPSSRIYIGQSKNIEKRLSYYSGLQCAEQSKIYNSLVKYGWSNHSFEIIDLCNEGNIDEKEIHWIKFYDSVNNGLNILHGGKGSSGRVWTRELREKLRVAGLGRKQSSETIAKRVARNTGQRRTEETKLKMSNSAKGIKPSPESIEKSRQSRIGLKQSAKQVENLRIRMLLNNPFKGKKHSEETKAKMRETKSRNKLNKQLTNNN